ncbi:hypothetical protein H257_06469 [Aphanomyces astaci]|uniref:PH domain-containing protein n=1 Tax=Aphanomyces astaci TaxID=112090 RepID=W4GMG7_APHAT|nr:hypothetical protein H257_06469 [Aphanomyces astaci]ETV80068.1 hypothetical protein H257_06469 [Aphanomyces astaci]|eukprot:XP_009829992.1 hypothetical protein H257_06469 [Aphanomyces astaci]
MEGYVFKQGHVVKSWQRRYFRLDTSTSVLEYLTELAIALADVKLGDEIGSIDEGFLEYVRRARGEAADPSTNCAVS